MWVSYCPLCPKALFFPSHSVSTCTCTIAGIYMYIYLFMYCIYSVQTCDSLLPFPVFKYSLINFHSFAEIPLRLVAAIAMAFQERRKVCRKCFYGDRNLSSNEGDMCGEGQHQWDNPIVVIPGELATKLMMKIYMTTCTLYPCSLALIPHYVYVTCMKYCTDGTCNQGV